MRKRKSITARAIATAALLSLVTVWGFLPAARAETGTAPGEEAAVPEALSLERAVSLALASSREVRQAERSLEQARMQKDDTWDAYGVILAMMYDSKTGTYTPLPKVGDPTPAVYQTYYAWKQAQRQLEATKESVVRQVYEKYYAVLQAASGLELKRLELEGAELSLRVAEARRAVGMETDLSVTAV
ncbi:MAG: hypothetical protein ACPLPT_07325, partial [Moorellales bacterium]